MQTIFFKRTSKNFQKNLLKRIFVFFHFFANTQKNLAKKFACQKNGTKTLKGAKNEEKFALSIKKC